MFVHSNLLTVSTKVSAVQQLCNYIAAKVSVDEDTVQFGDDGSPKAPS